MSKQRRRDAIDGYLFLLPNLLGFLIFMALPLALSFYYSFTEYDLLTPPKFVGLRNYIDALGFSVKPEAYQAALAEGQSWFKAAGAFLSANDETFWIALRNTVVYAVGMLVLTIPPAFMVAWLLNSRIRSTSRMAAINRMASAPWRCASSICSGSMMKSLRSTGTATRSRACIR